MSDKLLKQILANQQEATNNRRSQGEKIDSIYRILRGEPDSPEMGLISRVKSLETFKTWALRLVGLGFLGGGGTGAAWMSTAQKTVENVAAGKLGTH